MRDIVLHSPLDGWAMPLAEVPDPVFAGGMMGPGCAIDPINDTLHAPCAATVLTIHAAGHAITLATDAGAELLMHIGIDTVAMKGAGFTALVAPGARVAAGDGLIRFDLDAIVQGASAAVTPIIVTTPGWRIADVVAKRQVAVGENIGRLVMDGAPAPSIVVAGETLRRTMTIGLPHGLHARPAARIATAARDAEVTATLRFGDREVPCDSPTAMLGLGATHGGEVTITVAGLKAATALDSIVALLEREVDPAPLPSAPVAPPSPIDLSEGALAGITAAPGLAVGAAHWLRLARPEIPPHAEDLATERARLATALDAVRQALTASASKIVGSVMEAHRAILDDRLLIARAHNLIEAGQPAAAAYLSALEIEADGLRRLPDRRLAERADDLIDIGYRVAHAVLGTEAQADTLPERAILLADDLLPSQLIALDATRLAGIALVNGGPTSHVAIIAAGVGVPMLVAVGSILSDVESGAALLIDADQGYLHPAPDAAALGRANATLAARRAAEARAISGLPTLTADGVSVAVFANLASAEDAAAAVAAGAEGCGLLRTEFLFLDRETPPDVAEQAASYGAIADALGDRPLVIRLLDVGGDKPAPYLALPPEENPALGLRGVRVSLARPDILDAQLRAILALPQLARCRIMVPMVASLAEVTAVRAVLDRLCDELGARPVPLGVMIETPAAAVTADLIAPHVDFMSIGSNDLTQYVLAMDRGNASVAAGIDGLHPAVLRLIAATCEGASRHDVPVSVCGGLAADPLAAPLLVGLGVTTLSVPPARIAATKALVATLRRDAAAAHARAALDLPSAQAVRAAARLFAQELAA